MAARRLILVMLALLVLSSIAAALIPVERDRAGRDTTTTTRPAPSIPQGTFVQRTISAEASKPERIALRPGDQLALKVTAERPGTVEIPGFGEFAYVDPDLPVHFDLLALEPGDYPVRIVGRRVVATIEVRADQRPGGGKSTEPPGDSTTASTWGANSAS